jgi:hypothetical protein
VDKVLKLFGMLCAVCAIGSGLAMWGLWVQKNDILAERLYICAHKNMNEHGMGVEEAYIHCAREQDHDD